MCNKPINNVFFYTSRVTQNRYAYVILTSREVDSRPYAEAFIILADDDPIYGTRTFDWLSPPRDYAYDEEATVETETDSARSSAENCLRGVRIDAFKAGNVAAQSLIANDLVQDDNPAEALKKLRKCGLPDNIIKDIRSKTKSATLGKILDSLPPLPRR